MNILIVTSSALAENSVSNRLADGFEAGLRAANPRAEVVRRDVGRDPIPHLVTETVMAIRGVPQSEAEHRARALSDTLIGELEAADLIVIGSPMYNFGMSSTLKTWFDHVLRAKATFQYGPNGAEGLLKDKKAVVIESRAGYYSEGAGAANDSQEPHVRTLLAFMGIEDVTWVRAEKLAFGEEIARELIAAAAAQLEALATEIRPGAGAKAAPALAA